MTKIQMNWDKMQLVMSGHAGAAEPGKDIVCAGISTLSQALQQTLMEMNVERKLNWLEWAGSAASGSMSLAAVPKEEYRAEVRACFRLCVTGLRMMAESYPEYIELEEG